MAKTKDFSLRGTWEMDLGSLPRGTGFVRRWRAILAGAVTHVVERAKARRRGALDRRLLASFDDCKLRDIGIDRRAAEIDTIAERR